MSSRMEQLLAQLPQTQCTRCGFPDCEGYARALDLGEVDSNRCPPGGSEGVLRLSAILQSPALPLDPLCGQEGPRQLAWIDESKCIGCTLCIQACPVDCIIGSAKHMHVVIEDRCTGCELCIPACPVDCIHLENTSAERTGWAAWSEPQAQLARQDHQRRKQRLLRLAQAGKLAQGAKASHRWHLDSAADLPEGAAPNSSTATPASGTAGAAQTSTDQRAQRVAAALARAAAATQKIPQNRS